MSTTPLFWRDPALPHVELRKVDDGRRVCYAPHTHAQWSMGAITRGESSFAYAERRYHVRTGSLVMVNPEWVHACNPIENRPWAYYMLYLDATWLAALRHRLGLSPHAQWQDLATDVMESPATFAAFVDLAEHLLATAPDAATKQARLTDFLADLLPRLPVRPEAPPTPPRLRALAAYLDAHCADEVSLDTLCRYTGLSPGHLIRSFKQHFRMTPHAYLINRRIQLGQGELRRGRPIAEAALNAGFADQPHFQRTFKRLLAATPRQYRTPAARVE